MTVNEQRLFKREQLIFNLRVFYGNSRLVAGYVRDLSTQGVQLLSEEPMEAAGRHTLRIELPHLIEHRRLLFLSVVNCWSDSELRGSFYESGYRFNSIDAATLRCLTGIMQRYGATPHLHSVG